MNGAATCEIGPDDCIDEARYLSDLDYRRKIHEDLEIEGDEPIDLSAEADDDPAFDSDDYPTEEAATVALKKFMDDILQEVLDEIAAEGNVHPARPY